MKAGQTRKIDVDVANLYQPEVVYLFVEKYPGEYGGRVILQSEDAGYQTQLPDTTLNKPVVFSFEVTFTPWDAEVGKVTFLAKFEKMMWQYPFYDCSPYDDELRSVPVRVNK